MKKILCTLAAAALMATSFVGCGKGKDSKSSGSDMAGKWECTEMTTGGMTITEIPLVNIPISAAFQLELKEDGTFSITSGIVGGEDSGLSDDDEFGKWEKIDDETLKIEVQPSTEDGSSTSDEPTTATAKLDGDVLVMEMEEGGEKASMKFKRVNEFSTFIMTTMSMDDVDFDINFDDSDIDVDLDDSDVEADLDDEAED